LNLYQVKLVLIIYHSYNVSRFPVKDEDNVCNRLHVDIEDIVC